jgi:NADPH-dependent ferric siderophore reductase
VARATTGTLANCRTAAALPAINSLLDAIGDAPTKVFLESAHDDDREPPVGTAEVTWVDCKKAGEAQAYWVA